MTEIRSTAQQQPAGGGAGAGTSRDHATAAGWGREGEPPGSWVALLDTQRGVKRGKFSWLRASSLVRSANDVLAKYLDDLVDDHRARRVAAQRAAGAGEHFPDFVVDRRDLTHPSFLVLGDPGEGDASQYAVVAPLLAAGGDTDFMVICSDVIYPAGDVNDYVNCHYVPYAGYDRLIYALPGNHDWYDLLDGFMFAFCGAEPLAPTDYRRGSYTTREWLARKLWRRSSRPDRPQLVGLRDRRPPWNAGAPPRAAQPGPYYAIDTASVRLVCIDTGVTGTVDHEQGAWLLRVSAGPKPKVLLTGKPLIVDRDYHPCPIRWGDGAPPGAASVDDVVRNPAHNYVAAIGGDVHNYQRYPVQVGERTIQYIVSGGGGAYMHATHAIDPSETPAGLPADMTLPAERDVRLYPLRGDSLTFYAARFVPFIRRLLLTLPAVVVLGAVLFVLGWAADTSTWLEVLLRIAATTIGVVALVALFLLAYLLARLRLGRLLTLGGDLRRGVVDPDQASLFMATRCNAKPRRDAARQITPDPATFRLLDVVMPLRTRTHGPLYGKISEIFDSDEPPFFKSFLRVDVSEDALRIACHGVTGYAAEEYAPPVEDVVEIRLSGGG